MASTIAELWYGNIEPLQLSGRNNTKFIQAEHLLQQNAEKLEKYLHEKGTIPFQKYVDSVNEYTCIATEQACYDGFCLWLKLAAESFLGVDQSISR